MEHAQPRQQLRRLGRQAEALKLSEEALALRKAKLGPDHPVTLIEHAQPRRQLRRPGPARGGAEALEERLALRNEAGARPPRHAVVMMDLADSYAALGRHAEAAKLCEETFALKAKLGPDHPDTLLSMGGLAQSLVALDRPSESIALIDDFLRRGEGKVVDPRLVPFGFDLHLRAFQAEGRLRLSADRGAVGKARPHRCRQPVHFRLLPGRHRKPAANRLPDARRRTAGRHRGRPGP